MKRFFYSLSLGLIGFFIGVACLYVAYSAPLALQQFVLEYGFETCFLAAILAGILAKVDRMIPDTTLTGSQATAASMFFVGWMLFAVTGLVIIFVPPTIQGLVLPYLVASTLLFFAVAAGIGFVTEPAPDEGGD